MKKTILGFCFLVAGYAVMAQEDSTLNNINQTNSMSSNSNYNAYSAPSDVQGYFMRDYPSITNATWAPYGDWWRASYNNNGMYDNVYYNYRGEHFLVALPVTSTWVPDNVVSAAGRMFGPNIYDITELRGYNGQMIYQIRFLNNGQLSTDWLDQSGSKVSYSWRTDDMSNMNNGSMNTNVNTSVDTNTTTTTTTDMNQSSTIQSSKVKTKTKNSDGSKTKTKTVTKPAKTNNQNPDEE